MKWTLAMLVVAAQAVAVAALSPQTPQLTPEQQRQRDEDPENFLRPTEPLPPLTLEYFVGRWNFEWDVPATVFGDGGTIKGTETFGKPSADGKFIESDVEATGPGGSYKQHVIMAYNELGRVLSRHEKDSRGFESLSIGRISTDQGFYLISFDGSAFTHQGQSIRFKTTSSLMGPGSYRLRVQTSIDGGPFRNFGSPWWRKEGFGTPKP